MFSFLLFRLSPSYALQISAADKVIRLVANDLWEGSSQVSDRDESELHAKLLCGWTESSEQTGMNNDC